FAGKRMDLADEIIARCAAFVRQAAPNHEPIIAGIGDEQLFAGDGGTMRPAHPLRVDAAATVFVAARHVGLTENEVSGCSVLPWNFVPDENPPVACIANDEARTGNGDTIAPIERIWPWLAAAIGKHGTEIGLAEDDIGRLIIGLRQAVPDQNTMVPGIRHGENSLRCGDAGRHVESGGAGLTLGIAS